MLHEAQVVRRHLVNTSWSKKRMISAFIENGQNLMIFWSLINLNIWNLVIFPCNLQQNTQKQRDNENFSISTIFYSIEGISWEIWCSNRKTGRFDEKLGDSQENQKSWQIYILQVGTKICHWHVYTFIHIK